MRNILVALAVLQLSVAAAAPAGPIENVEQAKLHFQRAVEFYNRAAYDEAIAEYKLSYVQIQLPAVLFNVAQCYRLKGDAKRAIDYYQQFLNLQPQGRGSDDARSYIAELRQLGPATPAHTQPPPAAGDNSDWSRLIDQGIRAEGGETRADRTERETSGARRFAEREAWGLRGTVHLGVGLGVALDISPLDIFTTTGGRTTLDRLSLSIAPAALIDAGVGLRKPLSLRWDLVARFELAFILASRFTSSNAALSNPDSTSMPWAGSVAVDTVARVHPPARDVYGYFGFGVRAGVIFNSASVGNGAATGNWAALLLAGVLETGVIFGKKENWDIGLRFASGGGVPAHPTFYCDLSLALAYAFR